MYKDKDRQRQAVREATRRYRAKLKGITQQAKEVIPCGTQPVIPKTVSQAWLATRNRHKPAEPEPQSYNPMMVGYVPPVPE